MRVTAGIQRCRRASCQAATIVREPSRSCTASGDRNQPGRKGRWLVAVLSLPATSGPAGATPFAALHNDPVVPVILGVASIPATAEAGAARWRESRCGCRLGVMTRRFSRSHLQA